ncbi:MAG: bifunctional 2-methylcitrate dehydratase/aconitate hydratase [Candidatus Marinimicrobia bacterium]|nr:bifunctional 2-methylcitrate dehydratase/aconitate hydratase [Candidatus Neomarinimicrobiota bacterium]
MKADRMTADQVLQDIADYVIDYKVVSEEALNTARNCLIDTIGCGLLALKYPNCTRHLGPIVPGTTVENGARVFGRSFELDPVKAAWDIGTIVRWLDFNDTWLAEEWGHPSDNLGAIMALSDYISRVNIANHKSPLSIKDVLEYMIKAHEIQGILALENSFNKVGLDHVLLVRVASTAVATHMLGGNRDQIIAALSQAWVDGSSLRTYRHAPNAGSRKSWAAGDATSRAVRLSMMTMAGEMGMPSVLTTPEWGFYDVSFKGRKFSFSRSYGSYVMENILFKISYPAEFHAQTAVECALLLYPQIKEKLNEIEKIEITTHESALRIIDKTGTLDNPADRDHCMQYMLAVAMIEGDLVAEFYEDTFHKKNPLIDELRNKMVLNEDKRYSKDYLAEDKRSIANALQVFFKDGSQTDKVEVEYPVGHRHRRHEGIPLLEKKFLNSLEITYSKEHSDKIYSLCLDQKKIEQTTVNEFMDLFVIKD